MNTEVGDNIKDLPVDETVPSHNEIKMVETLFKQKMTFAQKLMKGAKEFIILFLLFIVFSIPQLDTLLKKFMSIESPYVFMVLKGIVFVVTYFIIQNLYLVKKKN